MLQTLLKTGQIMIVFPHLRALPGQDDLYVRCVCHLKSPQFWAVWCTDRIVILFSVTKLSYPMNLTCTNLFLQKCHKTCEWGVWCMLTIFHFSLSHVLQPCSVSQILKSGDLRLCSCKAHTYKRLAWLCNWAFFNQQLFLQAKDWWGCSLTEC